MLTYDVCYHSYMGLANEIFTSKGEETDDAKLVQEVYRIACPYELEQGDYIRRKSGK